MKLIYPFIVNMLIRYAVPVVGAIVLVQLLTTFFYCLNRGFPFHDEANYALSYEMAQKNYFPYITLTPFLLKSFLPEFVSLAYLKTFHLCLKLLVFFCFFLSLRYIFRLDIRSSFSLLVVALGACMFSSVFGVATLNYNHLAEIFFIASELFLFLGLYLSRGAIFLFASGVFAFLLSYVKIPSAVALLLLSVGGIAVFQRVKFRKLIWFYLLGWGVAFFVGVVFIVDIEEWKIYVLNRMGDSTGMHSPLQTVKKIFFEIFIFCKEKRYLILFALLIGMALYFCRKRQWRKFSLVFFLSYMGLICWAHVVYARQNFYRNFAQEHIIILAVPFLLVFFIVDLPVLLRTEKGKLRLYILLVLMLNPFIGAAGSFNGFPQLAIFMASWIIMLALFAVKVFVRRSTAFVVHISTLLMVCVCVVYSYIYVQKFNIDGPYDVALPLAEQIKPIDFIPKLAAVRVDHKTYQYLWNIHQEIEKQKPRYLLQAFDKPGITYAFNSSGVSSLIPEPWLSAFYPEPHKNIGLISKVSKDDIRRTLIIVENLSVAKATPEAIAPLKAMGFPDDFCPVKQIPGFHSIGDSTIYVHRQANPCR